MMPPEKEESDSAFNATRSKQMSERAFQAWQQNPLVQSVSAMLHLSARDKETLESLTRSAFVNGFAAGGQDIWLGVVEVVMKSKLEALNKGGRDAVAGEASAQRQSDQQRHQEEEQNRE